MLTNTHRGFYFFFVIFLILLVCSNLSTFPLFLSLGICSARVVKIMILTLGNISFRISNMMVEKLLSNNVQTKRRVVILCTSLHIGDGDGDLVGRFAKFSEKGTDTIICKNRKQGK